MFICGIKGIPCPMARLNPDGVYCHSFSTIDCREGCHAEYTLSELLRSVSSCELSVEDFVQLSCTLLCMEQGELEAVLIKIGKSLSGELNEDSSS